MVFISLLSLPLFIAAGFFIFTDKLITWGEFLAHAAAASAVAALSTGIMYYSNVTDVEVWGGHVYEKERKKVNCEHDYCCMYCDSCSTDSNGNTSCTQYCCQTCYDHSYDISWTYATTDDGSNSIPRVDRQGLNEPPRWTEVVVGEPSASSHSFTNYIKAAPDTLFIKQGLTESYKDKLPEYPGRVYDHYKLDRLVVVDVPIHNSSYWNRLLMEQNDLLGASKEVALGIVLVLNQPQEYFTALQQHWVGGKKNDLFLVLSVDADNSIQWAEVMAWTVDKVAEAQVRDAAITIGTIKDPGKLVASLAGATMDSYVRKPMKDFEYLKSSVTPTGLQWAIALIINILISIGLGFIFRQNEIKERRSNEYRY